MGLQTVPDVAPEVLIVGQTDVCEALVARVRAQGYLAQPCAHDAVLGRLQQEHVPGAVVLCTDGVEVAQVMRALRETPIGAAVVITLYGTLGEAVTDLADVLDLGADHFLAAPASDEELRVALTELAGPPRPETSEPGEASGIWPNRTAVIDGPHASQVAVPTPDHVLGQLHRTLDMLELRLREGTPAETGRTEDDDLARFGLEAVPNVEPSPTALPPPHPAEAIDVHELSSRLVLESADRGTGRSNGGPESTVRLEETGEVEHGPLGADTDAFARRSGRREPLEPELEAAWSASPGRDRPRRNDSLPIDRRGSLDTMEVPRLLWRLHRARYCGRLTLQHGKIEKHIWIWDGKFVFARSNVGHDRLSDGLLRRGVLTRSQYETARSLAEREPRRAGQILVEAGFLKAGELHRVLRMHLARILDSTFPWRSGAWLLTPGESCEEPVLITEPPARVLGDGIRNRMEPNQLADLLGGLSTVPCFDAAKATVVGVHAVIDLLRLTPSEEGWIERLDGRHSLAQLTDMAGADQLEMLSLVYLLHVMGYVELAHEVEPLPQADVAPEALDAQRVGERLRMSRQLDYFEILGLDRDACRIDVVRAYADLSATFHEDNLEAAVRKTMAEELGELRTALREARDVLVDDALRSAYLAHLQEP